jgi:hypothetical protein
MDRMARVARAATVDLQLISQLRTHVPCRQYSFLLVKPAFTESKFHYTAQYSAG